MSALPELPVGQVHEQLIWNASGDVVEVRQYTEYTEAHMREYGELCRKAAFESWWDTVANTPAPSTFKNWEESCRQAWQASRKAALEEAVAELEGMKCNSATASSAIKLCIEALKELK